MNLKRLLFQNKYTARDYLSGLIKLLPLGTIWNFDKDTTSPDWVTLDTYQSDDFSSMLIDNRWHNEFVNYFSVNALPDNNLYAQENTTSNAYRIIKDLVSGDFSLEFEINLFDDSGATFLKIVDFEENVICYVGYTSIDNKIQFLDNTGTMIDEEYITYYQFKKITLRLLRIDGVISAQFKKNGAWVSFTGVINDSDPDVKISISSPMLVHGISYLHFQADEGFSETGFVLTNYFTKLLSCFANELFRIQKDVDKLIRELIPGLSVELLEKWEYICGLPDESTPVNQTITQRQQAVHTKFTQAKGEITNSEFLPMSASYFIVLGSSFNMVVTVGEYAPTLDMWRWSHKSGGNMQRVTRMPAPSGIDGSRFNSISSLNRWSITIVSDPDNNEEYFINLVNKLKPAHTAVYFL